MRWLPLWQVAVSSASYTEVVCMHVCGGCMTSKSTSVQTHSSTPLLSLLLFLYVLPMSDAPPAYAPPPATGVRHRGAASNLATEARASAVRQVGQVASTASDAVTSGAWAYPLRGALYILSRA